MTSCLDNILERNEHECRVVCAYLYWKSTGKDAPHYRHLIQSIIETISNDVLIITVTPITTLYVTYANNSYNCYGIYIFYL